MSQSEKRILIVTRCSTLSTFKNKRGEDQQIYEVEATDEAGVKFDEKLRSFVELQLDVPIEYDVAPYDHEKYGRSYTLSPPSKQSGLAKSVDALRARVEHLERQNAWLYDRLVEKDLLPPRRVAETPQTAPNSGSESEDRTAQKTPASSPDDPKPEEEIPS